MQTVDRKISKEYFEAVSSGKKTFELVKDDEHIQEGDILFLWEHFNNEITGRFVAKKVRYVLRNALNQGLAVGYCVVSF